MFLAQCISSDVLIGSRLSHSHFLPISVGHKSHTSHREKSLINIIVILAGTLKILAAAKLLLQKFAFLGSELPIFSVTLVSHKNQIFLRLFRTLWQKFFSLPMQIVSRFLVRQVKDKEGPIRRNQIGISHVWVSLLPGCIPYLQPHCLVVDLYRNALEVHPDRGPCQFERIFGKSTYQWGFPCFLLPKHNYFEGFFIAVESIRILIGLLYRGGNSWYFTIKIRKLRLSSVH